MNNVFNHLFKLIKSGYFCKRSIKKCLKQAENSPAYRLAKYYDDHFRALEEYSSLTMNEVEAIIQELHVQRIENSSSEDAQLLLSNITAFFEELKPFIRENMA
jgi:hypothetical protein